MMENGRPPAIGAQGVFFQIEAKTLLDRVDLKAAHGQMVGLIGPNGAGKSTFLRAVSGVLRVQSGNIHLDGADLRSLTSKEVAAGLAIVPQIVPYTHGFTAMELVLMGRYPHLGRFQIEGAGRRAHRTRGHAADGDRAVRGAHAGHPLRRRTPARNPLPRPRPATANPAPRRTNCQPGRPAPAKSPRPGAPPSRRRPNRSSRHPRPQHGIPLLRPPSPPARRPRPRRRRPRRSPNAGNNLPSLRRQSRSLPRPPHQIPGHQPNRPRRRKRTHRHRHRGKRPATATASPHGEARDREHAYGRDLTRDQAFIPHWIDRLFNGPAGPDHDAIFSFGLSL